MAQAAAVAKQAAAATKVGDPFTKGTNIGPLASAAQFEKVQRLIKKGIEEGAELVAGGVGRPQGISRGYFVKPTVFARVRSEMTIAREEIFGPVLSIISYENGAQSDFSGCFGGYKQSGNGREWGEAGLHEFLELKAIFGYTAS